MRRLLPYDSSASLKTSEVDGRRHSLFCIARQCEKHVVILIYCQYYCAVSVSHMVNFYILSSFASSYFVHFYSENYGTSTHMDFCAILAHSCTVLKVESRANISHAFSQHLFNTQTCSDSRCQCRHQMRASEGFRHTQRCTQNKCPNCVIFEHTFPHNHMNMNNNIRSHVF